MRIQKHFSGGHLCWNLTTSTLVCNTDVYALVWGRIINTKSLKPRLPVFYSSERRQIICPLDPLSIRYQTSSPLLSRHSLCETIQNSHYPATGIMADDADTAITAILFHRASKTPELDQASHLTESTISDFMTTIQTIQGSSTSPPTIQKSSFLDGESNPQVVGISFTSTTPLQTLRTHPTLAAFEARASVEAALQSTSTYTTPPRLAVFDMDSTLIQQEVIDLLAARAGVEAKVSAITARAMNGELDFSASLRERVGLLAGLPVSVFEELRQRVTLTPGADALLRALRGRGVKTALLSGGFVPLARWVAGLLGIDYVHANELAVDEQGRLTGRLQEGCVIVDGARKRALLREIAAAEGIEDSRAIVAVGDGANDLPMLWAAGVGVAVNAKPRVQTDAPARLNGDTALLDVLYVAGLTGEDIEPSAGV